MHSRKNYSMPPGQITMIKRARLARSAIRVVATLLALTFAWLKFRGIEFAPVAKTLPAELIFHVALALYYSCWILGLTNDTQEQELVYPQAPKNVIIGCIVFGIVFFAAFLALCYVDTARLFVVVLAAFLVINVGSWQFFIKIFMRSATLNTRSKYLSDNNFIGLERLQIIYDEYLCGRWQWIRFIVGGGIVTVIGILAFHDATSQAIERLQSGLVDILISLLLLLFVFVMEVWIWIMRLKVKHRLSLLDRIEDKYTLRRKKVK